VTSVPPVLVRVSDKDLLPPTFTLPKLRLAGLAVTVPVKIPAPDNGKLSVEFDASELIVTAPVALPSD